MKYGILSHRRAQAIGHEDISMTVVQERRASKKVPNGYALHEYANLYFDAHNPMLSSMRDKNSTICVLEIDSAILELPDVVINDRNEVSDYARFFPSPNGLTNLNFDLIYNKYWNHDDPIEAMRYKSIKCAEVLVPDSLPANYITGAIVYSERAKSQLANSGFTGPIDINPSLFF